MTDNPDHTVKSPWKLEIDIENESIRRVRNTAREDGVPTLPLEAKLRTVFMGLSGVAEMLGDQFSATAVESKADELAYGWALLASENERVRIVIKFLVETSAWTEAAVPTIMVGGVIAYHYNALPDQVGIPLTKFAGLAPMSREQEVEQRRRLAAQMQKEAEDLEAQSAPTPPENGSAPEPDIEPEPTGTPSVVPIPPDADLGPSS